MKVQYVVYKIGKDNRELSRHDTYEEAEAKIMGANIQDLLGTMELYIQKIYTNKK
jgi:hypothetical protein